MLLWLIVLFWFSFLYFLFGCFLFCALVFCGWRFVIGVCYLVFVAYVYLLFCVFVFWLGDDVVWYYWFCIWFWFVLVCWMLVWFVFCYLFSLLVDYCFCWIVGYLLVQLIDSVDYLLDWLFYYWFWCDVWWIVCDGCFALLVFMRVSVVLVVLWVATSSCCLVWLFILIDCWWYAWILLGLLTLGFWWFYGFFVTVLYGLIWSIFGLRLVSWLYFM